LVGKRRVPRPSVATRSRAGDRAEPFGGERSSHGRDHSIGCRLTPTGSIRPKHVLLLCPSFPVISNKDRSAERRAFAAKCVAYLQRGIGLIIVDIVTNRGGNLHQQVFDLLGQTEGAVLPADTKLNAAAYRPAHRGGKNQLDLWPAALALGQPLP